MRKLLGESGISRNTMVVLYGDNNNWFATYAFWQMKMFRPQARESDERRAAEVDRRGAPDDH